MCLMALTGSGLTVLHDFTDDPKLLAEALSQAKSNSAPLIYEPSVDPHHPTGGPLAAALTAMIRGAMLSETQMASLETEGGGFHHRAGTATNRESLPRFAGTEVADLGELRLSVLHKFLFSKPVRRRVPGHPWPR